MLLSGPGVVLGWGVEPVGRTGIIMGAASLLGAILSAGLFLGASFLAPGIALLLLVGSGGAV